LDLLQQPNSGSGFRPGSFGTANYNDLDRLSVERLLTSWFAWLRDGSRIHIRPAGETIEAELQIRRWKTRPHVVLFRWRNSVPTREVFEVVQRAFARDRREAHVELTAKTGRPRAVVVSLPTVDVLGPAWAMGLAESAFEVAGSTASGRFDVSCSAHAMATAARDVPLIPLDDAWTSGFSVGRSIRKIISG
jgi:hypothetical protein